MKKFVFTQGTSHYPDFQFHLQSHQNDKYGVQVCVCSRENYEKRKFSSGDCPGEELRLWGSNVVVAGGPAPYTNPDDVVYFIFNDRNLFSNYSITVVDGCVGTPGCLTPMNSSVSEPGIVV